MITRRHFSLGLGAMAVAGCCTRRYPTASSGLDMMTLPRSASYLAPDPAILAASNGLTGLIDTHAHFFNASDVPVRDYLGQSIAHSMQQPVRQLLELLAPLATKIADQAPSARKEFDDLVQFENRIGDASLVADDSTMRTRWEKRLLEENKRTAQRVVDVTRDSSFLKRYRKIQDKARPNLKSGGTDTTSLSVDEVEDVVRRSRQSNSDFAITGTAVAVDAEARLADGVLGFLFYILSPRSSNLAAYEQAYRDDARGIRSRKVLGALVDFDYWQGCAPASSHDDQIALHRLLSERSNGFMKPLVAYNPWTDIELDGDGLVRVKKAIDSKAFAGVKLYPPSGFSPGENSWFKTKRPRPNLVQLDRRLDDFFDYCSAEGVVVMAHTNHSSGRDLAHDKLSSPDEWNKRLAKHNDSARPLKINLGHFGGESFENWAQDFGRLMAKFPHHNIYADIGFWDGLMCRNDTCQPSRQRLLDALSIPIGTTGDSVGDRVMYGTDWFMLSIIDDWSAYPPIIHRWLTDTIGETATRKIFSDNAAVLFGEHVE